MAYKRIELDKASIDNQLLICDRVAASKTYNGDKYTDEHPYNYFLRVKGKHRMHPKTEEQLNLLLEMLRDKGEKETFAYIRRMKK